MRQAEAAHASEVGGRSTSEEVDNISEVRHVNSHVLSMPTSIAIGDAGKDRDFPRGIASASHQEITVSKHAVCKVLTRVNRCCFQRSDNLEADSLLRKIRSRFVFSFFICLHVDDAGCAQGITIHCIRSTPINLRELSSRTYLTGKPRVLQV